MASRAAAPLTSSLRWAPISVGHRSLWGARGGRRQAELGRRPLQSAPQPHPLHLSQAALELASTRVTEPCNTAGSNLLASSWQAQQVATTQQPATRRCNRPLLLNSRPGHAHPPPTRVPRLHAVRGHVRRQVIVLAAVQHAGEGHHFVAARHAPRAPPAAIQRQRLVVDVPAAAWDGLKASWLSCVLQGGRRHGSAGDIALQGSQAGCTNQEPQPAGSARRPGSCQVMLSIRKTNIPGSRAAVSGVDEVHGVASRGPPHLTGTPHCRCNGLLS